MGRTCLGLAVIGFAACDFPPLPRLIPDGGEPVNTPASSCFQHWFDGSLRFSGLVELSELTSSTVLTSEHDPWISEDGLRLYFTRNPGPHGGGDIYLATRASTTDRFGTPADQVNLNDAFDNYRPALSGDELTIVLSTGETSSRKARIMLASRVQRSEAFPSPDDALTQTVNADSSDHFDPFLSRDGLRLYLAPNHQQIIMSMRASITAAFSAPTFNPIINRSGAGNGDPAVSSDERILVFSSTGSDTTETDLWYSTRPSSRDDFLAPVSIPGVNSPAIDTDPMLSADGCELYFSSARGGSRHIWRAEVQR